jgi:hypothetical protein
MKVIVINPKYDEYTECLHRISQEILATAERAGCSLMSLGSVSATRSRVESVLKGIGDHEAIVVFYGYGDADCLYGAHHEPIINTTNVTLFKNKVIYTVASSSGRRLGPLAIECGALSYLGYTDNLLLYFGDNASHFENSLTRCLNAGVKKLLLEHCPGKEAFQAMYDEYTKWYDYWLTRDFNAALCLFHNRESLVYLGDTGVVHSDDDTG